MGVKGSEKTVGALTNVKKGLGEVSSMSLEAKAGILAAVYGLEQLMSLSSKTGTGLTNFAALTGLSAQSLQQWQYAARQAGVSGEELTGSLKGVQNSMTNMLLGKGAPEGLAIVANKVGFDVKKARDSFYVMQQLQKAAQALPPDVGNSVLKSFGISEGTIAAMRRNAFNPAVMAKAPTYSDKEIGSLDKVNVAWSNLGQKIEMAMGHFTSKHGMQLVGDLTKVTTEIFKMIDALTKLGEKIQIFALIGKAFAGWSMIFSGATKGVDMIGKFADSNTKGKDLKQGTGEFFSGIAEAWKGMQIDQQEKAEAQHKALAADAANSHSWLVPKPQSVPQVTAPTTNINQTITHHGDAKDTKAVKDSHKAAINNAYRQRQQGQGS